jgi:site-specific DNA-cytosine methylase
MRVLVAYESSGVVRDAFLARHLDAWSCDFLPCESTRAKHFQGDALRVISSQRWDLVIAHPPCTALAVSGNRWYSGTQERSDAIEYVKNLADLMTQHSDRWAIENPVGVLSSAWRKPDQYIQPWQFGHGETKKTCLWLHNLDPLDPTEVVEGRENRVWRMAPGPNRSRDRSRTYEGIADAMAECWSHYWRSDGSNQAHAPALRYSNGGMDA